MEHQFWHQRWEQGRIGFHQSDINPMLRKHWHTISPTCNTVFVPLCGKTQDMWWLREQGLEVVGCELSHQACAAFFSEAGINPDISEHAAHHCYQGEGITLWAGDFFALSPEVLGPIGAFFDRAALIALPPAMRIRYAEHLRHLTSHHTLAPGLLITLEYQQSERQGPPFAVLEDEVEALYARHYHIDMLESQEIDHKGIDRAYCIQPL